MCTSKQQKVRIGMRKCAPDVLVWELLSLRSMLFDPFHAPNICVVHQIAIRCARFLSIHQDMSAVCMIGYIFTPSCDEVRRTITGMQRGLMHNQIMSQFELLGPSIQMYPVVQWL